MALCITGLAHDVADGRQSCVTGFDPPAWQIPPRGSFGGTPVSFTIGDQGIFRWMPPAEFSGTFEFAFVRRACSGREERIPLRVIIGPGG